MRGWSTTSTSAIAMTARRRRRRTPRSAGPAAGSPRASPPAPTRGRAVAAARPGPAARGGSRSRRERAGHQPDVVRHVREHGRVAERDQRRERDERARADDGVDHPGAEAGEGDEERVGPAHGRRSQRGGRAVDLAARSAGSRSSTGSIGARPVTPSTKSTAGPAATRVVGIGRCSVTPVSTTMRSAVARQVVEAQARVDRCLRSGAHRRGVVEEPALQPGEGQHPRRGGPDLVRVRPVVVPAGTVRSRSCSHASHSACARSWWAGRWPIGPSARRVHAGVVEPADGPREVRPCRPRSSRGARDRTVDGRGDEAVRGGRRIEAGQQACGLRGGERVAEGQGEEPVDDHEMADDPRGVHACRSAWPRPVVRRERPHHLEEAGALGGPGPRRRLQCAVHVEAHAGTGGRDVVLAERPGAHPGDAIESPADTPCPNVPSAPLAVVMGPRLPPRMGWPPDEAPARIASSVDPSKRSPPCIPRFCETSPVTATRSCSACSRRGGRSTGRAAARGAGASRDRRADRVRGLDPHRACASRSRGHRHEPGRGGAVRAPCSGSGRIPTTRRICPPA